MYTKQFSLLVTSDVHGYIYPTTFRNDHNANLGLAKIASIITEKRHASPTLLIDNGDFIQGSPLTFFHHKYRLDQPNPMVKVANALQYDAMVFGNHEFNYNLPTLVDVMNQSKAPWLAANILYDNGEHFGKPYIIKEIEGVRIAILGLTTHYVTVWEEADHIEGLTFKDAFESAKYWVEYIHQHEDIHLIALCYHGGFERDFQTGELVEPDTGENQGYLICKEIEGIDILITGHQHREIETTLFGKSVIQPGSKGACLGEINIEVKFDDQSNVMGITHQPSLIYVDNHTETDHHLCSLVQDIYQQTEEWLDQTIGTVDGNMQITDSFNARINEHPYVEFINKIQLEVSGASISNTALFHNEAGGFTNKVTMRDIVGNYIYPNSLKVLLLTGKDIYLALEQCASYFSVIDNKLVVNPTFEQPKAQPYNYDMWEGIEYEFTISNPIGQRVTKLLYKGKPIDFKEEFEVVMNSYRATGAGNFDMYKNKPVVKEIQTDMTEIIASYFMEQKNIKTSCNDNFRVTI